MVVARQPRPQLMEEIPLEDKYNLNSAIYILLAMVLDIFDT